HRRLAAGLAGGRGGRCTADPGPHREGRQDEPGGRAAAGDEDLYRPRRRRPVPGCMNPGIVLRSVAFALVQIVTVPPFALIALATFPLPALARYRIITAWSRIIVRA